MEEFEYVEIDFLIIMIWGLMVVDVYLFIWCDCNWLVDCIICRMFWYFGE